MIYMAILFGASVVVSFYLMRSSILAKINFVPEYITEEDYEWYCKISNDIYVDYPLCANHKNTVQYGAQLMIQDKFSMRNVMSI